MLTEGLLYLFIPYIDLFFQGTPQNNKPIVTVNTKLF